MREAKQSPKRQGPDEKRHYVFDFSAWGIEDPTDVIVHLLTSYDKTDMSATMLAGLPVVSGSFVTTPLVQNLEPAGEYLLTCQVTHGDEVSEAYCRITADRV